MPVNLSQDQAREVAVGHAVRILTNGTGGTVLLSRHSLAAVLNELYATAFRDGRSSLGLLSHLGSFKDSLQLADEAMEGDSGDAEYDAMLNLRDELSLVISLLEGQS